MDIMPISNIPDYEERIARFDAFWDRAIIDRPPVIMTYARPEKECASLPKKEHATLRDRWFDVEFRSDTIAANLANTVFAGDALPVAFPNLGPEVFSAYIGCDLEYGETTAWAIPIIESWDHPPALTLDKNNLYYRKTVELTDALLARGENRFYVGLTDLHAGGDGLAGLRDPQDLNMDLIDYPDEVSSLIKAMEPLYFEVLQDMYETLRNRQQACTTWMPIVSGKKWYPVSNDFSCMISPEMFERFFLEGIVHECEFLDASIYHLDGPGALKHLDALLAIHDLNAIQWVPGAGNTNSAAQWIPIYQKCQRANKGLWIGTRKDEVDVLIRELKPEGALLVVSDIQNQEEADTLLRKVEKWV